MYFVGRKLRLTFNGWIKLLFLLMENTRLTNFFFVHAIFTALDMLFCVPTCFCVLPPFHGVVTTTVWGQTDFTLYRKALDTQVAHRSSQFSSFAFICFFAWGASCCCLPCVLPDNCTALRLVFFCVIYAWLDSGPIGGIPKCGQVDHNQQTSTNSAEGSHQAKYGFDMFLLSVLVWPLVVFLFFFSSSLVVCFWKTTSSLVYSLFIL